ncbi:MAG TPA: polysaccharide biosynthesis tyrosine autokinase [Candidatus Omnitrophota bacterium]|nr:polysaccharide biosynthesis tyrosine autokinase [Candidatus Omnitrophota bacterium]HRZ14514.1 polysaccharide biosynthesis tyrosine autokinase [Candidatus Omnitrophota bacterium]
MPQYELNLRDYVRIFHRRRLIIATTFILVMASSFMYVARQPVNYRSSVTIKIEERKTIAGLLTEWILYKPGNVMESELRFIRSFSFLRDVAMRLGKISERSSPEDIHSAVSDLANTIATERLGDTNMIRIIVTSGNAKEARDLANFVTQLYIEENVQEKAKQFRQARQFMEEQLLNVQERIKTLEARLQQFSDEVKNIRLAEPMEKKIMDLEFQLAELLQKYTEKHPKVAQIRDEIKNLEDQIKGFSGQDIEYSRLKREVEVNKKMQATLNEKLGEASISENQTVSDISIVEPAVLPGRPITGNKGASILIGSLLGLIAGFALAFILETLDTSIGTIEDVENVVKIPVLGVVPSIHRMLSKQHAFERFMDKVFHSPKHTKSDDRSVRLISHYQPRSTTAESFRNIHTNLKLNLSRKTILVTSASPGEGKSCVVINLGIVMAQTGLKTLLVSTDLRRPVLAKTFGVKKEPGLNELITKAVDLDNVLNNITDIIVGDIKFEDIRKTPGIENIWILTAGHLPSNPVELLESKDFTQLVSELKNRFDVVIFDSPPVLPVTDASILAAKVDACVLVYEIGRTSRDALLRAKLQLESMGAKLAGVVLNHINPQTESLYAYPYYYHYRYRYYGKDKEPISPPADNSKSA